MSKDLINQIQGNLELLARRRTTIIQANSVSAQVEIKEDIQRYNQLLRKVINLSEGALFANYSNQKKEVEKIMQLLNATIINENIKMNVNLLEKTQSNFTDAIRLLNKIAISSKQTANDNNSPGNTKGWFSKK